MIGHKGLRSRCRALVPLAHEVFGLCMWTSRGASRIFQGAELPGCSVAAPAAPMDTSAVPDTVRDDGQPPEGETVSAQPITVGDILLGKYRVERVLGKGGMGMVLGVRHLGLDDVFALKVLLPGAVHGPGAVERFLREARVTARLQSDHVAKVFDVDRLDEDRPYMVMEYLRGTDLKQALRERGPLPVSEAIEYVLQACEALAEAHAQGVVHRDIKPSNLFLAGRPNGAVCVKLIDFGISKVLGPEGVDLTGSGVAMGSPLYMSPEQMTRAKGVGMLTDIWALGTVLYELVTGKAPFAAESFAAVAARVLKDEPPPPSHVRPDVPAWLDAVVMRCLQKAPEGRYQTADELAIALREGARTTDAAKVKGDEALTVQAAAPRMEATVEETVKGELASPELAVEPPGGPPVSDGPRVRPRVALVTGIAIGVVVLVGWLGRFVWQRSAVDTAPIGPAPTTIATALEPLPTVESGDVPSSPPPDAKPPESAAPSAGPAPSSSPTAAPRSTVWPRRVPPHLSGTGSAIPSVDSVPGTGSSESPVATAMSAASATPVKSSGNHPGIYP